MPFLTISVLQAMLIFEPQVLDHIGFQLWQAKPSFHKGVSF
jgi:hypothetical protein